MVQFILRKTIEVKSFRRPRRREDYRRWVPEATPAVWRKASGGSWALATSLSQVSAASGPEALTGVTHGPSGWLAVGAPGPVIMTSADGTTWQSAAGPGTITADLAGVSALAAAAGPHGYVIVGKLVAPGGSCVADVWWSPDLTVWTRAHDVNDATGSSQVLAGAPWKTRSPGARARCS